MEPGAQVEPAAGTPGDRLTARLALLEDERAITRTLYRYAHALYNGDRRLFLDCFTEDAVFMRSRHGKVVRGHDELGAFFDAVSHAPADYHKHVIVEPVIEIDGDRSTVESDFLYVQARESGPFISHFGHYSDELEREPDGGWRFTVRRVLTESAAPGPNASLTGSPGRSVR